MWTHKHEAIGTVAWATKLETALVKSAGTLTAFVGIGALAQETEL